MKGLGQIVIAARFKPADPILRIAARSQKEHRRLVALRAQRAAHA